MSSAEKITYHDPREVMLDQALRTLQDVSIRLEQLEMAVVGLAREVRDAKKEEQ